MLLINFSDQVFVVEPGERIAQMVLAAHAQITWEEVTLLSETARGEGGYGHTGK